MNGTAILRRWAWVLPGLFLSFGLLIDKTISATFFLAGVTGIAVVWGHGLLSSMDREERWFATAFLAFAGASVVSVLAAWELHPRTLQELEAVGRYLLAVPVFLLVKWAKPPAAWIWGAAMVGAFAAGVYGLHHMLAASGHEVVYGGVRHHIRFGVGAVTLGFVSLTAFAWLARKKALLGLLAPIALFLGLIGALASGSRTSWMAVPALLGIALVSPASGLSGRVRAALLSLILAGGVVAWFVPATGVADRVAIGVENIRQYQDERGHRTSVGARLEMWKAAGYVFRENPIVGVGVGGYSSAVEKLVADGRIRPTTERYVDPHNEYLSVAATRGTLGLVALALLLGVPILLFWRSARSDDEEVGAFATAGLMVAVGFAIFGLTHALSVRTFYITFYTMMIALCFGMVRARASVAVGASPKADDSVRPRPPLAAAVGAVAMAEGWQELLACPECEGELEHCADEGRLRCEGCGLAFSLEGGIPVMLTGERAEERVAG